MIDFQAQYGPKDQRRQYIKARIQGAKIVGDFEEVKNWEKQLKELDNDEIRIDIDGPR